MSTRSVRFLLMVAVLAALAAAAWFGWQRWGPPSKAAAGAATAAGPVTGAPAGGTGRRSGRPGGPGGAGGGERPVPVLVAVARTADVDIVLNGLGTAVARSTVTVRSRVDGQLVRLAFDEGQVVTRGQLLAEIDPRPFEVALQQVQGQLARDRAQLQNAQIDLARYQGLLAKDSIARQQVDTQAALVRQLQGTIAANQGQVDSARLQLGFTRITAPIGGRVGLRQVDVGNMVRASDANGIVVITEVQPIAVLFAVPSDNLAEVAASLRAGQAPAVEAWDRAGLQQIASGRLITYDNQIDATTGTIKLKAEFPNDDGALFPNQFVNVRLRVRTVKDALLIPSAAVQRSSTGPYVFVVGERNAVAIRKVTLGQTTDNRIVVLGGVGAGERVIVDGADRVRDGGQVDPVVREF